MLPTPLHVAPVSGQPETFGGQSSLDLGELVVR
jgi:hypothetical protein